MDGPTGRGASLLRFDYMHELHHVDEIAVIRKAAQHMEL